MVYACGLTVTPKSGFHMLSVINVRICLQTRDIEHYWILKGKPKKNVSPVPMIAVHPIALWVGNSTMVTHSADVVCASSYCVYIILIFIDLMAMKSENAIRGFAHVCLRTKHIIYMHHIRLLFLSIINNPPARRRYPCILFALLMKLIFDEMSNLNNTWNLWCKRVLRQIISINFLFFGWPMTWILRNRNSVYK